MEPVHPSSANLPFYAALYTAFICILFGANAVAIKISVAGVGPFTAAALRFSAATLALWFWVRTTQQKAAFNKKQVVHMGSLAILFTAQLSLFHLGISKTLASRGTLLANFQPFFLLFLAHYLIPGDRITLKKLMGLFLGFLGVVLVFLESEGLRSGFRTGDLMMLSASFLWALNGVYTKRIADGFEPYQLVLYPMAVSVPLFFLEAWILDPVMITFLDLKVVGALAFQSLVCAAFGFVAWTRLLKKYGAVALHSFIFIMPIAGVFLGGIVLKEPITVKIVWALILIVAGIITVQVKEKPAAPLIHPGRNL